MAKKLVTVMVHINEFKEVQIEVDDNKNLEDQVVEWAKRQYPLTDVVTDYFEDDDPFVAVYK
jgi:short-subunit dehydrogenase involved in D-alanine esterification of teichoic acids